MLGALVIPLLLLAQEGEPSPPPPPRVVALAVKGATASADYVTIQKHLARVPGTVRVSFWVARDDYHFHLYVREAIRLSAVQSALAAAQKEMKDTLDMVVKYVLDEFRLPVLSGSGLSCDGDASVAEALERIALLADRKSTDGRLETRVAPREGVLTLGKLRKALADTGARLDELTLAGGSAPLARFVCPERCSESANAGFCPSCSSQLVKGSGAVGTPGSSDPLPPVGEKPPPSGGC